MANVELYAKRLLVEEGGFVNNPNDKGGATNKGVTLATFREFYGQKKTIDDLKILTNQQFIDILKTNYWDKLRADEIHNQSVAEICVDWLYNSGIGMISHIQSIAGTTNDGVAGEQTIEAINNQDQEALFNKIKESRKLFYEVIVHNHPSQEVFLQGWLNRVDGFHFSN